MEWIAHFTFNVNHISGKTDSVLTDYFNRNLTAPPQTDEAYDEEYVINSILEHYKFIYKHNCLSNHNKQSKSGTVESEHRVNNKPRSNDARQQTAIDCANNTAQTRNFKQAKQFKMNQCYNGCVNNRQP